MTEMFLLKFGLFLLISREMFYVFGSPVKSDSSLALIVDKYLPKGTFPPK